MLNCTLNRKHYVELLCLHDSSPTCRIVVGPCWSQRMFVIRLIIIIAARSLWLSHPSDKGLGWVSRATRGLNNLYAEHVFRRNMRNARTYLIWHLARTLSRLRTEDSKSRGEGNRDTKRSECFLTGSSSPI